MSNFFLYVPIGLLLLLVLLFVGVWFGKKRMFGKVGFMHPKFHYYAVAGFMILLMAMTFLVEVFYAGEEYDLGQHLLTEGDPESMASYNDIEKKILAGNRPDSPLLVASRSHPVGETLEIRQDVEEDVRTLIYIEHKKMETRTVEEFIYKPFLIIEDYDFTHKVELTTPVWTETAVTIPKMDQTQVQLANFWNQSLAQQFTTGLSPNHFSRGFGSVSGFPIIHLIVPDDVKIITPEENVIYINEP